MGVEKPGVKVEKCRIDISRRTEASGRTKLGRSRVESGSFRRIMGTGRAYEGPHTRAKLKRRAWICGTEVGKTTFVWRL